MMGFASLAYGEYVDFLYVDPDYQREKVADRLFDRLSDESYRIDRKLMWANVSKSALPFFTRKGFLVEKKNHNMIGGVRIINYKMVRHL